MKTPRIDEAIYDPSGDKRLMRYIRSLPEWQEREFRCLAVKIANGEYYPTREPAVQPTAAPAPAALVSRRVAVKRRGRPVRGRWANGAYIQHLRADFSQEDFAGKCAVSLASLQRMERGERVSEETLEKVGVYQEAIGMPVRFDDLILENLCTKDVPRPRLFAAFDASGTTQIQ